MKKKKILLIALLLLIISVGAVNAEYINETNDNLGITDSNRASSDNDLEITDSDVVSGEEPKSFSDLDNDIYESPDEGIDITSDYKFNNSTDENLVNGISLNINPEGTYTINGNNHVIDANNQSGVFKFNYGTVIICVSV